MSDDDAPTGFEVSVREDGDRARVAVVGDLDLFTADVLRGHLNDLRSRHRAVVLDLSGLGFIDSTGLRLLLQAQADAREDGWSFAVDRDVAGPVARLLDLTNAWSLLEWRP